MKYVCALVLVWCAVVGTVVANTELPNDWVIGDGVGYGLCSLPPGDPDAPSGAFDKDALHERLFHDHRIEVPVHRWPAPPERLLRISAQVYNSLDEYERLLDVERLLGAKHSSLDRVQEIERLEIRDRRRPEFRVYTGNDLAIDMVMYGSDYLLGLSTFAPDYFALRDRLWEEGDARFHELNDLLQYLGQLTFRPPVPAYRHSAAQFLHLRGWLESDDTHPEAVRRPQSDLPILRDILARLEGVAK